MPPTLAAVNQPSPNPLASSFHSAAASTGQASFHPAEDTRNLGRPHRSLLLVEDDPFIRPLLIQILTKANYDVFPAEDGHRALELYRSERSRIQGAIIDIILPDIHGTEVFAEIRRVDAFLPVVLISGFSTAKSLALTGPAKFLQKPFNPQELLGALDQLFHK